MSLPRRLSLPQGIVRLMLFLVFLSLWLLVTDFIISTGLRRVNTSSFGVMNRIIQGRVNAEIVISGSSRALTHYDPRIIQQKTGRTAFNVGLNGSQTDMQLARLEVYLKHNQKPKLLVQNFDLFSFMTSHEIYDPGQYIPYLSEEAIYGGVRRVYPDAWKWKYLPLYGYAVQDMRFNWIAGLGALAGFQPREDHFMGYRPRDTSWTGDFDRFRQANPKGITVDVESQGVVDFENLLQLCVKRAIPVIVVFSPEYFEMQKLEINRGEIIEKVKELTAHYGIEFWDYSDSRLCREQSNFYNSQHLNSRGARAFSDAFASRLSTALSR